MQVPPLQIDKQGFDKKLKKLLDSLTSSFCPSTMPRTRKSPITYKKATLVSKSQRPRRGRRPPKSRSALMTMKMTLHERAYPRGPSTITADNQLADVEMDDAKVITKPARRQQTDNFVDDDELQASLAKS